MKFEEEIGDLFVTESEVTVKLHPSCKTKKKPIAWFADGEVQDHRRAVRDIQGLVEGLRGKTRIVRGLTVTTDRGAHFDLDGSGLGDAVEKAGFSILN
ncbi:MAG: hypothetical protein WC969_08970 [Elusimicrobiota bacterium]|jgi:hypothetical protein